jgi:hypothetical protein
MMCQESARDLRVTTCDAGEKGETFGCQLACQGVSIDEGDSDGEA